MTEVSQAFAGWSLAIAMSALAATILLRSGRRRVAINEALHELRRPLQALALAGPSGRGAQGAVASSVRLAAAALERLERAVNGDPGLAVREPVRVESVLRSAVGRWKARVVLAGGSLELRWRAGEVVVEGDRTGLEQAVDNLIVNAIEHGGPTILVEGRCRGAGLRITVVDSGRGSRPQSRRDSPSEVIARLSGRRRHGHGLAVVRRVAADHLGRFVLHRGDLGTVATLELPLDTSGAAGGAA
jgi:signal transduction histidine kinase